MEHKAKKSLGQNFLKSREALIVMCNEGDINTKDTILEIGPGKGALTKYLLSKSKKVIAVEKDKNLIKILEEKFSNEIKEKNLILIEDDILGINTKKLGLKNGKYKIIANIPYYITGAIIKKFLTDEIRPEKIILLVQKEVAWRIIGKDKKESILSLSIKIFGNPRYIMKVGKKLFSPSPKVDSAIIAIDKIENPYNLTKEEVECFFNIVKASFAHKRKVLKKNLESIAEKENIEEVLKNLSLDKNTRAEDISIDKWIYIVKNLK